MEIVPEEQGESAAAGQRDELHMQQQRMGRIDKAIADYKPDRSLVRSEENGGANDYSARNTDLTANSQTPFFRDISKLQGSNGH